MDTVGILESRGERMSKKIILVITIMLLVVSGSALAWVILGDDLPKKAPIRARQVRLDVDSNTTYIKYKSLQIVQNTL